MIAGLDRYFQIARCFRDEDLRADRQPEFTQVDIEMSFADEKQVMDMAEGLMIRVFKEALGADIPAPFPRMTWDEAMSRYGVDKPDTRFGLELQDVTSIVSNSGFKLFASAKLVKAMRVPGGESLTRKEIDELTEFVKIYGAQGLAWIKIRENEWQSPIAKFLSDEERAGLTEALGLSVGDIVFFQAGEPGMVNAAQNRQPPRAPRRKARPDPRKRLEFPVGDGLPAVRVQRGGKTLCGLPPSLHRAQGRRSGEDGVRARRHQGPRL